MTFPREAYEALEGILGPDYVSDDPAVCQAYLRGGEGVGMWDWDRRPPTVVVLPESTEQVQAIVQVANRYQFPYVPISTFMIAFCSPSRPNTIMIDPKRMNQLVIDPQNQMAIVQPYVTYANLQSEAFKYGLFTTSPLCGAQASVLANHLVWSIGQPAHRVSYGHRRILGMEWVLPDGRLLRTGALASGKTDVPFWGEGPGPDLRGMVRNQMGHMGGLGFVTRLGVKLFAMPQFEPERAGVNPYTRFSAPEDKFRWYVIFYDNVEGCVEAMYKIGQSEIGWAVMRVPALWRPLRKAINKRDFFEIWGKEIEEVRKKKINIFRVALCGYAGIKQLEYEERVLKDIAQETGGVFTRAKQTSAGDAFQNGVAACAYKPTGAFMSQKLALDSVDHALKQVRGSIHLKYQLQPEHLIDDAEEAGWIMSYDFGHISHSEETTYYDNTEEESAVAVQHELETVKYDVEHKSFTGWQLGWSHALLGPEMCHYHELMQKFRDTFDRKWLSNPPRFHINKEEKKKKYPNTYPYRPGW